MTKRVAEMTEEEYLKYRKYRKKYQRQSTEANRLRRATLKAEDPEAYLARVKAYNADYITRKMAENADDFRKRLAASSKKYHAAHREERCRKIRERYRRKFGTSPDKADDAITIINATIPRHLPPQVRDEVRGELLLALIDGTVKFGELAAKVPEYVRAHNRQYDHHRVMSLDENIPGMKSSWLDALPDDAERF